MLRFHSQECSEFFEEQIIKGPAGLKGVLDHVNVFKDFFFFFVG